MAEETRFRADDDELSVEELDSVAGGLEDTVNQSQCSCTVNENRCNPQES